jgi:hypothetical protein
MCAQIPCPVRHFDTLWLETCEFSLEDSHVRTKTFPVHFLDTLWLETCEFSLEDSHVRTKTFPVHFLDTLWLETCEFSLEGSHVPTFGCIPLTRPQIFTRNQRTIFFSFFHFILKLTLKCQLGEHVFFLPLQYFVRKNLLKTHLLFLSNTRNILLLFFIHICTASNRPFFIERDLHSYTRHIERGSRGERDIVPSTQDLRPRICSLRQVRVSG